MQSLIGGTLFGRSPVLGPTSLTSNTDDNDVDDEDPGDVEEQRALGRGQSSPSSQSGRESMTQMPAEAASTAAALFSGMF